MSFLNLPVRLRRNRASEAVRELVQETRLYPSDLIPAFFVVEGQEQRIPIRSLPGLFRFSIDQLLREVQRCHERGIHAVALFPVVEAEMRSDAAEAAWDPHGLMPRAIRAIKERLPALAVIADVALDPYTSHGHDGLLDGKQHVANDLTVEALIKMALVYAEAGVDWVAPSDMMDGRVGAIRTALDEEGHEEVGIFAYSIKYASSLYAPFREALGTRLQFGDKRSYQLNPANRREALLEACLDEEEGADILMVKPALFYLDIIRELRGQTLRPIAAYHVSGEYAMVAAAHQLGFLEASAVFYEALLSIKRAGADCIITYAAPFVLEELDAMRAGS